MPRVRSGFTLCTPHELLKLRNCGVRSSCSTHSRPGSCAIFMCLQGSLVASLLHGYMGPGPCNLHGSPKSHALSRAHVLVAHGNVLGTMALVFARTRSALPTFAYPPTYKNQLSMSARLSFFCSRIDGGGSSSVTRSAHLASWIPLTALVEELPRKPRLRDEANTGRLKYRIKLPP